MQLPFWWLQLLQFPVSTHEILICSAMEGEREEGGRGGLLPLPLPPPVLTLVFSLLRFLRLTLNAHFAQAPWGTTWRKEYEKIYIEISIYRGSTSLAFSNEFISPFFPIPHLQVGRVTAGNRVDDLLSSLLSGQRRHVRMRALGNFRQGNSCCHADSGIHASNKR